MATRTMWTSMGFVLCILVSSLTLSVAQLNLYISKADVNSYLKMNFNFDLYMIKDDQPAKLLQDPRAFREFISPLPTTVNGMKMTWFSSPKTSSYSLKLLSSDTEVMHHPIASIGNKGVISHSVFSFYVSLGCTGKKTGLVDVSMMLNYTTIKSGLVQSSTLKTFSVKVRKWCEKTVKDADKKTEGISEWSRGAIVGLSAGITVFLCLSVGLGLLFKHYLKQRRFKMEFEDELEIEEKREFGKKKIRSLPIHKPQPFTSASPPPVIYSPKRQKFGIVRPRHRSETNASDISTVGLICKEDSDDEEQRSRQSSTDGSVGSDGGMTSKNQDLCSSKSWSKVFAGMLINPAHLQKKELIGTGTLCDIYYGLLNETTSESAKDVTVKTLKGGATQDEIKMFVQEVMAVKDLKHPNLVTPLGVVLQPSSTPQVVMPYIKYKELKTFLREEEDLSLDQVLNFGCQIAKAMDYLASKDFVHKNLTSAHCLVDESYEVKVICDNQQQNKDCIKWMAPECLTNKMFSQKSDVWSFGILLWEIASAGHLPYQDHGGQNLLEYLLSGNRLPQTLNCPNELYSIMLHCWSLCPETRPTFSWLVDRLSSMHFKAEKETTRSNSMIV